MGTTLIRTLIVDDEPIGRQVLREGLQDFPEVEVVGEAANGREALDQIASLKPDLVFLDLQMPVMDGFEVVQRLDGATAPMIAIVTAFNQHAMHAFEAGAVDYLLKPVSDTRLRKTVERALSLQHKPIEVANEIARIASMALHGNSADSNPNRKVVGRNGDEYFILNPDEILAFQAEGELVWIVTAKSRFLANHTLRAIAEYLRDRQFERVHRNAIVNVNHVRKMSPLSSQRWLITLSNTLQIIVSKRQARNIQKILHW